jgi:DNA-binding transcriptional regulator YiaG
LIPSIPKGSEHWQYSQGHTTDQAQIETGQFATTSQQADKACITAQQNLLDPVEIKANHHHSITSQQALAGKLHICSTPPDTG